MEVKWRTWFNSRGIGSHATCSRDPSSAEALGLAVGVPSHRQAVNERRITLGQLTTTNMVVPT